MKLGTLVLCPTLVLAACGGGDTDDHTTEGGIDYEQAFEDIAAGEDPEDVVRDVAIELGASEELADAIAGDVEGPEDITVTESAEAASDDGLLFVERVTDTGVVSVSVDCFDGSGLMAVTLAAWPDGAIPIRVNAWDDDVQRIGADAGVSVENGIGTQEIRTLFEGMDRIEVVFPDVDDGAPIPVGACP